MIEMATGRPPWNAHEHSNHLALIFKVGSALLGVLGAFGWTSVNYVWPMVFKATINQSEVILVHPNDPENRCAESLSSFLL